MSGKQIKLFHTHKEVLSRFISHSYDILAFIKNFGHLRSEMYNLTLLAGYNNAQNQNLTRGALKIEGVSSENSHIPCLLVWKELNFI